MDGQVTPAECADPLRSYDMDVRLHIVPRVGRRQLGKLTARDARQMLDDMRRAR